MNKNSELKKWKSDLQKMKTGLKRKMSSFEYRKKIDELNNINDGIRTLYKELHKESKIRKYICLKYKLAKLKVRIKQKLEL